MREHIFFYGLVLGLGLVAGYFRLSYISLGILLGLLFSVACAVTTDGSDPPLRLGIAIFFVGIVGFVLTFYIAKEYGLSFDELYNSRPLRKFGRRLPLYSMTALTTGILLVAYTVLGKLSQKYD